MSNDSRFVADSLEAFLVSIAGGVREAQDEMSSAPPVDAFGRAMPTYHLPYLDFEMKVDVETVNKPGRPLFLRINPKSGSGESVREISSSISGRLVAVPPGEGLPTPILTISSLRLSARRHKIAISAINTAGELLVGQGVELNINMEASRQLSAAEDVALTGKRAGTVLDDAVMVTDESGSAETIFTIDSSLPSRVVFVLTAELGTGTANLRVSPGDES
jgi:hypothetical protein